MGRENIKKSYVSQRKRIAGSDVAQVTTIRVRAGRWHSRQICLLHGTCVLSLEPMGKEASFLSTFVLWLPHKHLHPCASTHKCALHTCEHTCTQAVYKVKLLPHLTLLAGFFLRLFYQYPFHSECNHLGNSESLNFQSSVVAYRIVYRGSLAFFLFIQAL